MSWYDTVFLSPPDECDFVAYLERELYRFGYLDVDGLLDACLSNEKHWDGDEIDSYGIINTFMDMVDKAYENNECKYLQYNEDTKETTITFDFYLLPLDLQKEIRTQYDIKE